MAQAETLQSAVVADALVEVLQDWEDVETRTLGALTGYHDIDEALGGLPLGALTVLAARPAMGKTSLALNIARNIAFRGGRVLYCSLDDSSRSLSESVLASIARLDTTRFRSPGTPSDWRRALTGAGRLYGLPLHFLADRSIDVEDIRAEAVRLHSEHDDLELLVVDWSQLLPSFEAAIEDLTVLASELGIAVLVLSQVDRQLEARENKMPRLRDLLGPPTLEERADLVIMLKRNEYYDLDDDGQRGLAELWVAKNRSGPLKRFTMAFLPEYRLFADLGGFTD